LNSIRFIAGDLPEGYTRNYSESLFNSTVHRQTQSSEGWASFYIVDDVKKTIEAGFHCCMRDAIAYSPYRATFGGIDFPSTLANQLLDDFIDFIETYLIANRIHTVQMKLAPTAYSPAISILTSALIKKNYTVKLKETGSVLSVSEKSFSDSIQHKQQHLLKRAADKNYYSEQLPHSYLEPVYTFIHHHQQLKGYSLSMSFAELSKTAQACSDHFKLFVTKKNQQIISASIAIQVNESTLYNFYLAHDNDFKKDSPVLITLQALYRYCQNHSCTILDLGTSMLGEAVNQSLLDFKLRLGAVETTKLTLTKQLKNL
jgi:hypothetical protein